MGLNRHKLEADRKAKAEAEAAARRATEKQILEDADYLITVWNERQARRMGSETSFAVVPRPGVCHNAAILRSPATTRDQFLSASMGPGRPPMRAEMVLALWKCGGGGGGRGRGGPSAASPGSSVLTGRRRKAIPHLMTGTSCGDWLVALEPFPGRM